MFSLETIQILRGDLIMLILLLLGFLGIWGAPEYILRFKGA
jgi:hypothetical protein